MVISKSKVTNKNEEMKSSISQSVESSSEVRSSPRGGGVKTITVASQQLPMLQEKMIQKDISSSVMKSSSSTKVSSSSQEQKFFSSSTSSSSSSKAVKSGKTEHLKSQSDDFLRGERMLTDIDAKRSNNGSVIIESIDLQTSSSNAARDSNLQNLVSVEIESKDSYAQHKSSSTNEFYTNTQSTFSSSSHSADQNRNDVIAVESGKSNEKNSTVAVSSTSGDQRNETSLIQGSNVSSSATYEEFSSSSMASSSKNNNETKAAFSKNAQSSKTIKGTDGKSVADTTTTFTSKVYDDKTKTWVVVEQSSVNETDIILPGVNSTAQTTAIKSSSSSDNNRNTMSLNNNNLNTATTSTSTTTGQISSNIDSMNMNIDSTTNMTVDSSTINNKMMHSDTKMTSKSSKEVLEKNMSSKKESSRNEKTVSSTSNETIQVFDSKTNTWINVDTKSFETQKRPSYVRYRSQDESGKWHTIYKRKLFDEFSKQWRIIDEKVVSSDDTTKRAEFPEMIENIENASNITTTTYTTKVYDTKTGKWTIVEEKSYVDSEPVNVTQDIKREIEKDQPDIANIITTTETTKVSTFISITSISVRVTRYEKIRSIKISIFFYELRCYERFPLNFIISHDVIIVELVQSHS
jgi:hypothetical protein